MLCCKRLLNIDKCRERKQYITIARVAIWILPTRQKDNIKERNHDAQSTKIFAQNKRYFLKMDIIQLVMTQVSYLDIRFLGEGIRDFLGVGVENELEGWGGG